MNDLKRFIKAQEDQYSIALQEIRSGRKRSHWMWFIFPQIAGLGQSETARFYAIRNLEESKTYLEHPVLGSRLKEITTSLLQLPVKNARLIFGSPDDLKLRSSMTLFSMASEEENNLFQQVIEQYFGGELDHRTVELLNKP